MYKYLRDKNILNTKVKNSDSYIWKNINKVIDKLKGSFLTSQICVLVERIYVYIYTLNMYRKYIS